MQAATQIRPNILVIPAKPRSEWTSNRQLRVAAYCRVSTDEEEQLTSYEAQIKHYTEHISTNPDWTLAGIFADEGLSGTLAKKRPEFQKMISLCKKKKIDLILTKSVSRFARNTVDCLQYIRELKELGIAIIFEKENLNTMNSEGELMITLMSCFAQAESESISKNVSWGIRQSFKNGKVPIQYSKLYGYKKGVDNKPEIIEAEAEVVRLIYTRFLDGYSMKEIADMLTEKSIVKRNGETIWNQQNIKQILNNEKYCGCALLQKTYVADCISKKIVKNNGELPMYFITNNHPAIIDKSVFDKAREELARRNSKKKVADKFTKTEQGKYSSKYALSELLICGECGTPYRRVTWSAKGFKEYKWRCINRLQYAKKYCKHSPTLDESVLHDAIVAAINSYLSVKDEVADMLESSIRDVLSTDGDSAIFRAEQRIKEIQDLTMQMIVDCQQAGSAEGMEDKFLALKLETEGLRSFIERERYENVVSQKTQSEVDEIIATLRKMDFEVKEFDDVLVRHLVEQVRVLAKDEIVVIFKGGMEIRKAII